MPGHTPCCATTCIYCLGGLAPPQFLMVVAGIGSAVPPTCGDCGNLNDSYATNKGVPRILQSCFWRYRLDPPVCGVASVIVELGEWGVSAWRIYANLVDADDVELAYTYKNYFGTRPDCLHFDGEDMGTVWINAGNPLPCSVAGASVQLTAI